MPSPKLLWKYVDPSLAGFRPEHGSEGAIGLDLRADRDYNVCPARVTVIGTNIAFAIPEGYYGRVAPRSGLAANDGIDVLAGVIDADYRGEIKILLTTHGLRDVAIKPGQKVAQLILERADRADLVYSDDLGETGRGVRGFGSTG